MKNAEEIKQKKLDILKYSIVRPEMYAFDHHGVEIHFRNILDDLSFIDETESELQEQLDILREKGMLSAMNVAGRLSEYFKKVDSFSKEVASIYAEIACKLGYLKLENTIAPDEWDAIYRNAKDYCLNQDRRLADIVAQFGDPSLEIGNVWYRIHCYSADDTNRGWIFFDYWNEYLKNFDSDPDRRYKYRTNPILRDVRLPCDPFKNGIIYTPYGRGLR